ncbi:MAG: GNAT family N-acetyltransferase [Lachnospiraceae bacterium]|nr:GNAT family N-acetyltransferase [Lachnospiraceae bacterium]
METVIVRTEKEKKSFIAFIYELYRNDPAFCDMNLTFVKNFLYRQDGFAKRNMIIPVQIKEKGEIKAECIFIIDETPVIKLSFPEFKAGAKKYLLKLKACSEKLMKRYGKEKTIIGINGQISYGLGILTDGCNREFEFNSNYNRDYYTRELDEVFPVIKKAFSYNYEAEHSLSFMNREMLDRVYKEYEFRYLDLKHFKRDMLVMGELCHRSLKDTPYYSEKKPYEMYELMKQVRFIMKSEDIIFAIKDGKEIGFIYTHPDYAELFDRPKLNYLSFYLRFLTKKAKKVVYNVIGVLPEHQSSGVAMALIDKSIRMRMKDYTVGVSSFILEDNIPSTALCRKLSTGINKEFHLYEIRSREDV